jgi:hypothetical protein
MKLKTCLTFFTLSFFHIGLGKNFKAEKLIGDWEAKHDKVIQTYKFIDASHVIIYNNNVKTEDSPLRYRLEKITASSFIMILSLYGDTDKTHESKEKCTWLNDNQFKTEPAQIIIGGGLKNVFTRKK